MNNERVYFVEWRSLGSAVSTREIIVATTLAELFDYYNDLSNVVSFAFEDITEQDITEFERKILYDGKYSV